MSSSSSNKQSTVPKTTKEDIYGQRHPIESKELIQAKLMELESELSKLSEKERVGWEQAKTKCAPKLINDDFKLMFLRCEVFNADLAAKRLTKYWNKRIEIFGPTFAFQELTLDKALKDDHVALHVGMIRLTRTADPSSGRRLLMGDPSRQDRTKYTRLSMVRAMWYLMHAALEDETSQKKGLIFVAYPNKSTFSQFDRTLEKQMMESIQGCLPIRVAAIHICHPPSFFRVVWAIVKLFLSARLRKRVHVWSGSEQTVLDQLEKKYGLTKAVLPTEIGGDINIDIDAWLKERKAAGK